MKQQATILFMFTMLAACFYVGCQNPRESAIQENRESFRDKPVQYTKHARCLMDCKHLSEKEIEKLISKGKLNSKESFPRDKPCPTFALEGFTKDSQHVRVIVGECAGTARVITVIDMVEESNCRCR